MFSVILPDELPLIVFEEEVFGVFAIIEVGLGFIHEEKRWQLALPRHRVLTVIIILWNK